MTIRFRWPVLALAVTVLATGAMDSVRREASERFADDPGLAVWLLFLALVLVSLIAAIGGIRAGRSLQRLARATRQVAAGDFELSQPAGGGGPLACLEAAFFAMARDVRQQLQERDRLLVKANRELERRIDEQRSERFRIQLADRMATLGQLAAGIGHEINNPLSYVMANLSFVQEELARGPAGLEPAWDDLRDAVGDARDGVERIRTIVRDLRTVSRGVPDERTAVDVGEAIRAAAKLASHEIRQRAGLELVLAPVRAVLADQGRLTQVFLNLLVNAAQAFPENRAAGGLIRVDLREDPDEGAVVEVTDNGAGIPPELLDRIFDPFFTTKPVGQGTGLGLSVCRGIVTEFGGEIQVTSAPGRGSTFRLRFPLAPAEVPACAAMAGGEGAFAERAPGPRRILVVDDERGIGTALRRLIGRRAEVRYAADGVEALQLFASEGPPDVVLCDLLMPGMSGRVLYEEVGRLWPGKERRFVFMTGGPGPTSVDASPGWPPAPVEQKPFDVGRLVALLLEGPPAPSSPAAP